MIVILDYGVGNLLSISKALEYCGAEVEVARDKRKIIESDGLVLPGVGAFKDAMHELSKIAGVIKSYKKPILGICLGMQLLFTQSEEGGRSKGLGLVEGEVTKLPSRVKIPHIGWNEIEIKKRSIFLKGIKDREYFYFVHSYYVAPKESALVTSTTTYGIEFAATLEKENILATQFHPEKSSKPGLRLLKNFFEITRENIF